MRRSLLLSLSTVCIMLNACRPYEVALTVALPAGFTADELALTASVYAPGALSVVDGCPAFAFGDARPDDIASSLVARAALGAGEPIDVPRTGAKLVVVEGVDNDGDLAVFGCADVGDVDDRVLVDLDLRPTARLVVDAVAIEVTVPVDAAGLVDPAPAVTALDARDRPITDALVRVRVVRASGESEAFVVVTDALGVARPAIEVDGAGPFLVHLDAEAPFDDGPPPLSGFARPSQTEVRPFGAVLARWAVPARLGDRDIAFIGATAGARVLVALPTGLDIDGRTTFAAPVDVGLDGDAFEPIGGARRPDTGRGVFVVREARTGDVHVVDEDGVVAAAPGTTAFADATFADLQVVGALPVGACVDRDQGPLLLVLRRAGELTDPTYALLDVATGALSPVLGGERSVVRGSVCVGAAPAHRALFVDPPGRAVGLVDLGAGFADALDVPDALGDPDALAGALAAGQGRLDDEGTAFIATFAGVGTFVDELTLDEDGAPSVQRLYPLPTIPSAIQAARATGGDALDHLHLLFFPGASTDDSQGASLYVVARLGEGEYVAGTAELPSCRGVAACRIGTGDVDGDGLAEIFVGAVGRRRVDAPVAEVLRLAPR